MREYREKQKALTSGKSSCKTNSKANVSSLDKDIDKDIDKDKKKSSVFTPPTLEQVSDYCAERKNSVNPQRFIDYYTSNGWMVGRTKMKDWKAAVRNWESKDKPAYKPGKNDDLSEVF